MSRVCSLLLGACNSDLAQAQSNLAQCSSDLGLCGVDLGACDTDLTQCDSDLSTCLATGIPDTDGDGETDSTDACPGTATGVEVDDAGCSLEQFCTSVDATVKGGRKLCKKADWKNDEPIMKRADRDCRTDRNGPGREDDECVALSP